jgi:hypothetical protein
MKLFTEKKTYTTLLFMVTLFLGLDLNARAFEDDNWTCKTPQDIMDSNGRKMVVVGADRDLREIRQIMTQNGEVDTEGRPLYCAFNCKEKFGDYSFTFVVKNTGTAPVSVTSIPAFTGPTGTITGFTVTPTLPVTINAGLTQTFTGNFTYSGTYPGTLYATVSGNQVGNTNLTSQDTEKGDLNACICDACKTRITIKPGQTTSTANGNTWNITQSIVPTAPGFSIAAVKAEIISFERYVGDECMECNKDATKWGNFSSGTLGTLNGGFANANNGISGNTHHSLYWQVPSGFTGPLTSFNWNMAIPTLSNLACCCDRIVTTIRYTYTFKNTDNKCIFCSVILKYQHRKGNCGKTVEPPPKDDPIKD